MFLAQNKKKKSEALTLEQKRNGTGKSEKNASQIPMLRKDSACTLHQ